MGSCRDLRGSVQHGLAHLNLLACRDFQLTLIEHGSDDPISLRLQTDEHTLLLLIFRSRLLERLDTFPTMRGGEHLHVQPPRRPEDEAPNLRQDRIVQPILHLVNEQKAIFRIHERQDNAEHTLHAVTETAKGDWLTHAGDPHDGDAIPHVPTSLSYKAQALNSRGNDPERLDHIPLDIGKSYVVPELSDLRFRKAIRAYKTTGHNLAV